MTHLNPSKTGLSFAAFIAGVHVVWAVLVALGLAQPLVDFIFWAHMIAFAYIVRPFDLIAAVTLIIITALIGYVFGYFFAIVWNRMHR